MLLVRPAMEHLPSYRDALLRDWSPDNINLLVATRRELAAIADDPERFIELMEDRACLGGDITLPDGSTARRLPGFRRWMWHDGEFVGSIGLRWQPGTSELPPHVLGHIGYSVVPWHHRRGFGTDALRQILPVAKAEGLAHVYITTQPDNEASRKVILSNGGVFLGEYTEAAAYGGRVGHKYRIAL